MVRPDAGTEICVVTAHRLVLLLLHHYSLLRLLSPRDPLASEDIVSDTRWPSLPPSTIGNAL